MTADESSSMETTTTSEESKNIGQNGPMSDEDSLKTSLQSLAVSLSGPSTKEQVHASNAVQKAVKKAQDLPEGVFKGLSRVIVASVSTRSLQRPTLKSLRLLLATLDSSNHNLILKHLSEAIAALKLHPAPSVSVSKGATSLACLFVDLLHSPVSDAAVLKSIAGALCTLGYFVLVSKPPRTFTSKLTTFVEKVSADSLVPLICSVGESSMEAGLGGAALLSLVFPSLCPDSFLNLFGKGVLMAKQLPPFHLISGSNSYLKHLTLAKLNELVVPQLKKALLRSPEVAVYGTSAILSSLSFCTDSLLGDLLKPIIGLSTSTSDEVRIESLKAVKGLASNSTEKGLASIYNAIVAQINGCKSPEQKTALLETLEGIESKDALKEDELDKVIGETINSLSKMTAEANEMVVRAQWNAISTLARRVKDKKKITALFQDWTKLTGPARSAALRSLSLIIVESGTTDIPSGSEKIFLTALEKSGKEPLESVPLSLILLHLLTPSSAEYAKTVKGVGNDLFLKEKHLQSMKSDDVRVLNLMAEKIIQEEHDIPSPLLLRSLVVCSTWKCHSVRSAAHSSIKRLSEKRPTVFPAAFATELYESVENGWIDQMVKKTWSSEEEEVGGSLLISLSSLILTPKCDYSSLAIPALLLSSLPRIAEEDASQWLRWFHQLEAVKEAKEWISSESTVSTLLTTVLGCANRSVRDDALAMLVSVGSEQLKKALWTRVEKGMEEIDYEDYIDIPERSVQVWRCPQGTLFNKEILDFDETAGAKNAKRENKAYSYKEQMAELELMRELAEKRRKEGKMTPKQKEMMDKELAKEKAIRDELSVLYSSAERSLSQLNAMVKADGNGAMHRPALLVKRTIPLLRSHLISKEAAATLIAFVHAAFSDPEDALHDLAGHVSLRNLGSRWIDERWSEESRESQLKRLLSLLIERVFVVETGEDTEEEAALLYEDSLGAPQLSVLHPLFTCILENDRFNEASQQQVLEVLKNALNRRLVTDDAVLSLPLVQMASLLMGFASTVETPSTSLESFLVCQKFVSLVNDTGKVTEPVSEMVEYLLDLVTHSKPDLREAALKCLSASQLLSRVAVMAPNAEYMNTLIRRRILVARFDEVDAVSSLASNLWFASLFSIKNDLFQALIDDITSDSLIVRDSAVSAFYMYNSELPEQLHESVLKLNEVYTELRELTGVELDQVGRVTKEAVDRWEQRLAVAQAAFLITDILPLKEAMPLINLVVPNGLDDRSEGCRDTMIGVGVRIITAHGKNLLNDLLPILEDRITKLPDGQVYDNQRQGLVILLGTLAKYIGNEDKVRSISQRLVEALKTPSQKVQVAVSTCLAPLVPFLPNSYELLALMQKLVFEGATYGERRGAAYGMAGLVKGLGIPSVRENDFINQVHAALTDKTVQKKQGALLSLEILSSTVGKLFEPYLIKLLPGLLLCFGDSEESVRKAAQEAARTAMRSLSPHGVKCIMPKVLEALDNDSWRTKCAGVDLLGAMAFCAPRQLSSCLPKIVPKLIEILADSHSKVRMAGNSALRKIASVIQNPEILGVSNQIMEGLTDPATKTSSSLNTIVNTKFIHYIDAASLALIMPIVRRAFEDRNSETRRLAAQIISNIYRLSEDKDMEPYLGDLVPGLQKALMDPVPEIRTVAAKALGAVVSRSKGDTSKRLHTTIIPWLKDKLISETSTVDRSGAAQGLSEVLAGVGQDQLDYVMPEIIDATESTAVSAETRDGYILMYIYLPMVFGDRFIPYLPQVVPSILRALADENEYVRASALKAGQRLINQFVSHARKMLLPQLQDALIDENWRIRHAGVQLVGDFLFNISGISGKSTSNTSDEDDTMGMEQVGKTLVRALGQKCRDDVLAALYLLRSDVALMVRQGSSHIWKMIVSNTPRTLKEIMKTLFEKVLESLASTCEERQQTGARCLGELVRKMGEKIILEVLPVLEEYLDSSDVEKRLGVAVALHEIIANMSKDTLSHYLAQIVVPIRVALCDDDEQVRDSAAETFHVFYNNVGNEAYDEVIAPLLEKLTNERDNVLDGLAAVMRGNSRTMLPYVLPRLTRRPVKSMALCTLAAASGDSLGRQLSRILDALLNAAEKNDQYEAMIDPCEEVILSVTDEEGIEILLDYLFEKTRNGNVPSAVLLHAFIEKTTASLEEFTEQIISGCIQLYTTSHDQIADHIILAFVAFSKKMDPNQHMEVIPLARKLIGNIALNSRGQQILGFTHPKSLNALVTFFREGILQGSVDTKATSAEGLGQLVSLSTADAVKPHVVNMTGPLIRVLGDRFPPNVKSAILSCLSQLLDKVSAMLRPFLPQLQSTFLKSLQDGASRPVRLASAGALARLVRLSPKPEPIVTEMVKTIAASADKQLLETTLVAARQVIQNSGVNAISENVLTDGFKASLICINGDAQSELDESITGGAGAMAGQIALRMGEEKMKIILNDLSSPSTPLRKRVWAGFGAVEMTRSSISSLSPIDDLLRSSLTSALAADAAVAACAVRAASYLLMSEGSAPDSTLLSSVGKSINHASIEVRKVVGIGLAHVFSKLEQPLDNKLLKVVVPHLVNGTKESNSGVRSASELALIYSLCVNKGDTVFNEYLQSCEGAAKTVLSQVLPSLARVVRNGDLAIENLDNILTAR
ncbi:hypothetical protein PFISCL1PPCAC_10598 [Pristionchus fissidentatus]|uniref:TOG domain-containing protein n=1 Tax=Pristionchus fissidentatus TaxID=1538716 RepID=A0AAV5VIU0_9BILA|nr:hypothetical protein PFISCL1PPCAC_10598 [Pristionchus fissidentatus]